MIAVCVQQAELLALLRHGAKASETPYAHLLPSWLADRDFAAMLKRIPPCGYRTVEQATEAAKRSVEAFFDLGQILPA